MNVFRVLGDVSHTLSKCILIWAIHSNKSAEGNPPTTFPPPPLHCKMDCIDAMAGVSLITQALYILVFLTRYIDLFYVSPLASLWNFVLKIFYITSSVYIIFIMMRVYARTREREKAWKLGAYCLGGSLVMAPIITAIPLQKNTAFTFIEVLWTFSIILESVCVIPQLLLLRQTTVPTVIDSGYILTLGSYRAFYILNWIVRLASSEHHFEWRAVLFGIIQTAFYVDFAWVYYTRQRVKLRSGGIVDSDDLSRGFLVNRVLGKAAQQDEEEETAGGTGGAAETGNAGRKANGKGRWGARGISVSADDTLEGAQRPGKDSKAAYADERDTEEAQVAHILSEDEEDAFSGLARDVDGHADGHV